MRRVRSATAVAVPLALLLLVTAALYRTNVAAASEHPIFFYLLPAAVVLTLYGGREAILFAFAALACSAFFFYAPIHSFYVSDPRAWGELICFGGLTLIGAKCATELWRRD